MKPGGDVRWHRRDRGYGAKNWQSTIEARRRILKCQSSEPERQVSHSLGGVVCPNRDGNIPLTYAATSCFHNRYEKGCIPGSCRGGGGTKATKTE